jgi:hypothetical protein
LVDKLFKLAARIPAAPAKALAAAWISLSKISKSAAFSGKPFVMPWGIS